MLAAAAIFLPVLARTHDMSVSLKRAIPLVFICMCAFITNDLDDIERDRINHPDRPLPSGRLAPNIAVIFYFTCLGLALFSTRSFVDPIVAFGYYALALQVISYGYVVEFLPAIKAPYAATAIAGPVLILAQWYPTETQLYPMSGCLFLLALGREICMDVGDRKGDVQSIIHRVDRERMAVLAFALQAASLAILLVGGRATGGAFGMALLWLIAAYYWFTLGKPAVAIRIMKVQFAAGLLFLMP